MNRGSEVNNMSYILPATRYITEIFCQTKVKVFQQEHPKSMQLFLERDTTALSVLCSTDLLDLTKLFQRRFELLHAGFCQVQVNRVLKIKTLDNNSKFKYRDF